MSVDCGWDNPAYETNENPVENVKAAHELNGGEHLSKSNGDLNGHVVTSDHAFEVVDAESGQNTKQNGVENPWRLSTISGTSDADLCETENDDVQRCGWWNFRPQCIQCCYGPTGFLFFLCIFVLAQSMTCNGFVYVVTSTLERRFNLSSAKSGAISSSYDFTVMAIIVFVTYFGEKGHKPMWLGGGAIIFGIGSWVFTFPHFFSNEYTFGVSAGETCPVNQTIETDDCSDDGNLSRYYWYFIIAQILHGFGSSPIYTHGQTFIYNNVKPGVASMYIGIFMAVSTFAPAVGYIFGAMFLSFYTDLRNQDELDIDQTSPLWVGAWWIGFIISGTLSLLVAIPLYAFPKHLPGWKEAEEERAKTAQVGSEFNMQAGFEGSIKDFPRAVYNLVKNIPLMCINFAVSSENMIVASVAVFGPKYIESMFSMTPKAAALIIGLAVFPTSLLGCLLGGWLIKRFKWLYRGQLRMVISSLFVSWLCMLMLMLTCPNLPMGGVTREYSNTTIEITTRDDINLTDTCNVDCLCGEEYDPICGDSNNIIYYSACHAGCKVLDDSDVTKKVFSNCSCIPSNDNAEEYGGTASQGRCTYPLCSIAAPFLICVIIVLFTSLLIIVPSVTMLYAVVSPNQRTTAMGVQSLMYRAFGTVPGPILFGLLIDKACLIWEYSECDDDARVCWLYDNSEFGNYAFKILFSCRFVSICFFILAYLFYKPISDVETPNEVTITTMTGVGDELPDKVELDDSVVATSYQQRVE